MPILIFLVVSLAMALGFSVDPCTDDVDGAEELGFDSDSSRSPVISSKLTIGAALSLDEDDG